MIKKILIIVLAGSLSGCDIILDEIFDCINQDEPQFNYNQFPTAILNQVYSHTITASIKNNSNDNRYDYRITFNGNLPNGLALIRDGNDRTITVAGTPIELGEFYFTLHVKVEDPYESAYQSGNIYDDGDTLCKNTHSQNYTISVAIM